MIMFTLATVSGMSDIHNNLGVGITPI